MEHQFKQFWSGAQVLLNNTESQCFPGTIAAYDLFPDQDGSDSNSSQQSEVSAGRDSRRNVGRSPRS
jgi:hypothetical protein